MHCRIDSLISGTLVAAICLSGCKQETSQPLLDHGQLAAAYFQEDSSWYKENIPFFECSDKQMEAVYYYRWKMYKAHIRNTDSGGYVITEFINHVPWDRDPFCTINAATMHHIYEGRWLRDDRFIDGYINNMFGQGGNNRSYSESVADASWAHYLVNSRSGLLLSHLDSMTSIYQRWNDHWDSAKSLYYIPAMPDATEYTIASIDASGGTGGFEGGEAFRPTINSYMYGNAMAISKIAAIKGDKKLSGEYLQKALSLKNNVEQNLWNDSMQHFCDRFQVNNKFVRYWDFIRGRELAGMAPWYFNLPADNGKFNAAWEHVTDTNYLLGPYGFRTNEPSYEYYFRQFVYFQGQRGSQWNGPSWPYQNSQTLTGMANLLNNYQQQTVTASDYVKLLRLFALQHYLPTGKLNLVENYDPNLGGPIVYYYWSNHYNHSSFNNLIITGLCGIRPSESDTLDINPLVDSSIRYFCLDNVRYHGHQLTVVYDEDGSRYNLGKGVTVFVDGKKRKLIQEGKKYRVVIGTPVIQKPEKRPINQAFNIRIADQRFPEPSASVNSVKDSLKQAVDGKIWYFPEISNYWSTAGSATGENWYAVDFGQTRDISSVKLYLYTDSIKFDLPDSFSISYLENEQWKPVQLKNTQLNPNTVTLIPVEKIKTTRIRLNFVHKRKDIALVEMECY